MHEVNGFFLFELGQVAMLAGLPANEDLTPSLWLLKNIRKNLHDFAEAKENKEDLPNSVDDAADLVKRLDVVIERNPTPLITRDEIGQLAYRTMTFRDRLAAELGRVYSFVLDEKGGRSVKTLWTKPLTLIPHDIAIELSEFTIKNIEEAAKTWVVDRRTATGFHIMRSVECVLRQYKILVTGRDFQFTDKRGTVRYDGFGTIVNDLNVELESLKKANAPFGQLEFIIGILRPLSRLYRDPIAHPELKELEEADAKLAFEHGLNVIERMVRDALDGGTHFKLTLQAGSKF